MAKRGKGAFRRRLEALGEWPVGTERWPLINAAHDAFDPLWRSGLVSRNRAYDLLAKELRFPKYYAHFGRMHPAYLKEVPSIVAYIENCVHERLRR